MKRRNFVPAAALSMTLAMTLAACEAEKSENPLSPSVAGPIPGVEITPPQMIEPAQGSRYKENQQPIRLAVGNATSSGVRPLYYTFEVASDSSFQTKMFARSQVQPGSGQTSVTIDRLEVGRTYYWRARAEDGANTGPFATVQFEVLPRAQLGAPPLLSPINNQRTGSVRPDLVVGRADRNAAVGPVGYEFHVALDTAFAQVVATAGISEGGDTTTFTPSASLIPDRQHFWRVRASDGETTSQWSPTQGFVTAGSSGPAPSPGPAPGGPCNSSSAEAIVSCERSKYGHMSHGDMFNFMRSVAQSLNRNGISGGPFGILRKQSGTNCNGYSCDVLCAGQGSGQRQWDVLGDIDGAQTPGFAGPHTLPGIRVDVCEIQ